MRVGNETPRISGDRKEALLGEIEEHHDILGTEPDEFYDEVSRLMVDLGPPVYVFQGEAVRPRTETELAAVGQGVLHLTDV